MNTFKCFKCKQVITNNDKFVTGYGIDKHNHKICYACCGKEDNKRMFTENKITLYLSKNIVSNWPGTLKIQINHMKIGRHNIAGKRYDVWFNDYHGNMWHGVQYGDFTQILHCRKLKPYSTKFNLGIVNHV